MKISGKSVRITFVLMLLGMMFMAGTGEIPFLKTWDSYAPGKRYEASIKSDDGILTSVWKFMP